MKKLLYLAGIIGIIAGVKMVYPTTMKVVNVDYDSDIVTLMTATGFTYEMKGTEDYAENDMVSLIMFNNGTSKTITDDKILMAKYVGF